MQRTLLLIVSFVLALFSVACGDSGGEGDGDPGDSTVSTPGTTSTTSDETTPVDSSTTTPVDSSTTTPVDSSTTTPVDSSSTTTDDSSSSTSDDSSSSSSDDPDPPELLPLHGTVDDIEGFPLESVRVLSGGEELTQTDAQGEFTLEIERGVATALTFELSGYVRDHKPVLLGDEAVEGRLDVVLVRSGPIQVLADAAEGGMITGPLGGRVTFPANALVDADGTPIEGPVAFTMTPIDFRAPLGPASFPGSAAAVDESGEDVMLESFGVMDITFIDDGRGIQIADDATATIEIPLTAGELAVGDTTPLWSLDPDTGLWVEEGMGEVINRGGNRFLRGDIPRLRWWNCDIGVDAIELGIIFRNPDGSPYVGDLAFGMEFATRNRGIFRPFLPQISTESQVSSLVPTNVETRLYAYVDEPTSYAEATKTIEPDRDSPIEITFESVERFTLVRGEELVIPMDENEAVYIDVELDADEVRLLDAVGEDGLVASARRLEPARFTQSRPIDASDPGFFSLYAAQESMRTIRIHASEAGTLRVSDGTFDFELDEVRRVELDGSSQEFTIFLRKGQWVHIGARSADPENTTSPFVSLSGFTGTDGTIARAPLYRMANTGVFTLNASTSAVNAGEFDIVVRLLDPPQQVPFSPASIGTYGEFSPGFGGGRLFELPIARDGAVEAWARAMDGESGTSVRSVYLQNGELFTNGPNVRNQGTGATSIPRVERGFSEAVPDSRADNSTLVVFIGTESHLADDDVTLEYMLSTWNAEVDDLVVGDPDDPECEPNARSVMAAHFMLADEGTITFCPGVHNLRDGEIRLDDLHMQGAGMDETELFLWQNEAIEDGRGSFARADAQNWSFRDLSIDSYNIRSGNEPRPAILMRSQSEPSTLVVERVRFVDRNDVSSFGGSGINFANNTTGMLDVTIRDSEFENMDTAIRGFSAARALIERNIVTDSRQGLQMSDVIEFFAEDNDLTVQQLGIRHDGNIGMRSVIRDNIIDRPDTSTSSSAYCITGVSRERDDIDPPHNPALPSIISGNRCAFGTSSNGIWMLAGGAGGAIIENNVVLPFQDATDAIGSEGIRLTFSSPNNTVSDDPGLVRIANNVLLSQRNSNGTISLADAHNQGPIEVVNNTIDIAGGSTNRMRGIAMTWPTATSGALPITILNNLINGSESGNDDGITLTNADVPITSAGNFFGNIRESHAVRNTGAALPGYGADNTSSSARVSLDAEGRPAPGSGSIDAGVEREEVPETDIDGVARPQGDAIDAGAHEQ